MTQRKGTYNGHDYIREHFDSIDEFLQIVEARPISKQYQGNSTAENVRSEHFNDTRWTGAEGYSDAKRQFVEGTKAKGEMQRAYTATQTSRRRETVNAPCGGAPIVAAALLGLPNSMIDTRRKREPKTARVIVNMSIKWTIKADQIIEAGKKIIAAVGKLDGEGIATEIICSADKDIEGQYSSCGITIKNAGQAFNAARVSFSMSSPAFLRCFQFIHTSSQPDTRYSNGYGAALPQRISGKALEDYYRFTYGPGIYISLSDVVNNGQWEIDRAITAWRAGQ